MGNLAKENIELIGLHLKHFKRTGESIDHIRCPYFPKMSKFLSY